MWLSGRGRGVVIREGVARVSRGCGYQLRHVDGQGAWLSLDFLLQYSRKSPH